MVDMWLEMERVQGNGHFRISKVISTGQASAFTLRADALERFRYVDGPEFEF
jgi:hypothetical protein